MDNTITANVCYKHDVAMVDQLCTLFNNASIEGAAPAVFAVFWIGKISPLLLRAVLARI